MAKQTSGSRVLKVLEAISFWPVFFSVLAMALMVTISIASRYFGYPIQGVEEYTGFLAAVITMIGLMYIQRRSAHISIDLLPAALRGKKKISIEAIHLFLSTLVIILLFGAGIYVAYDSFIKNRVSNSVLETPMGVVQLIVPIGLALFLIQLFVDLFKKFRALASNQESTQEPAKSAHAQE